MRRLVPPRSTPMEKGALVMAQLEYTRGSRGGGSRWRAVPQGLKSGKTQNRASNTSLRGKKPKLFLAICGTAEQLDEKSRLDYKNISSGAKAPRNFSYLRHG